MLPAPGDWAQEQSFETFSGTVIYRTTCSIATDEPLMLDLGTVGDIAEVFVNGKRAGVLGWSPYRLSIGEYCRPGENALEIRITNSMANRYEGAQRPSGLIGPVLLRQV